MRFEERFVLSILNATSFLHTQDPFETMRLQTVPGGAESPESVRQRSNLAELLAYAQGHERKWTTCLAVRTSIGLRRPTNLGGSVPHITKAQSASLEVVVWGFGPRVVLVHGSNFNGPLT